MYIYITCNVHLYGSSYTDPLKIGLIWEWVLAQDTTVYVHVHVYTIESLNMPPYLLASIGQNRGGG